MKRILLLVFLITACDVAKSQTLQSVYDNGRFIQTAPSMPVVIKAGADAHGLQIWGRPDGYGYIEFFNELGGGPQRAIFGYESRLNYEAPAHNFIGNIGIGNTNPTAKISFKDVNYDNSDGITWYSGAPLNYGIYRTPGAWAAPNYQQLNLSFDTGIILNPGVNYGKSYVDIKGNGLRVTSGDIGIGTTDTKGYKLAVNGKIRAHEIKVETTNWPDYVFAEDYKLPTLQETEKHIKDKGHLPGIPSANEAKTNGIDLGEMNAKLLQKVEELTLHLIEKDKEIAIERNRIDKLEQLLKKTPNK